MQIIKTPDVPAAIGPYSQGVVSNGFLFTHGVLPLDKDTGLLVGDTIEEQAEQVLKNMLALIKAGGSDECHIVKTNVFITDMSKFAAFNAVYAKYFKQDYRRTWFGNIGTPWHTRHKHKNCCRHSWNEKGRCFVTNDAKNQ